MYPLDSMSTMDTKLEREKIVANVNVRGLSDRTKEALRVRAAQAGMSLESFARRELRKVAMTDGSEPKPIVDLARRYFGAKGGVELETPERGTHRPTVDLSR